MFKIVFLNYRDKLTLSGIMYDNFFLYGLSYNTIQKYETVHHILYTERYSTKNLLQCCVEYLDYTSQLNQEPGVTFYPEIFNLVL